MACNLQAPLVLHMEDFRLLHQIPFPFSVFQRIGYPNQTAYPPILTTLESKSFLILCSVAKEAAACPCLSPLAGD